MVIYILLLLSSHIKFSDIHAQLTLRQMTFINPDYIFCSNDKLKKKMYRNIAVFAKNIRL